MSTSEFSNEFDIMYNNIMSNQAPGLNEYEKSVFLTEAQNAIVIELYSGRNNKGLSFESSEEVRRILHNLITSREFTKLNLIDSKSFIEKPENLLFIINEECILEDGNYAKVIPTKQDFLYETLKNPFKGPSKNRVLRVDSNPISLYSKENIKLYRMNYIKIPNPIILGTFSESDGVTINSKTSKSECELHESIHSDILQRAVLLAKAAYTSS